jgi:hypothetical protein
LPLLDKVKPLRGRRGRPRKRPDQVIADRGYDHDKYRREIRRRGIKPVIARRGTDHASGPLGDRAQLQLAAPVSPAAHPRRARPPNARSVHAPRLRDHLLAPTRPFLEQP